MLPRSPVTTTAIPVLIAEHFMLDPATGITKPDGPGFFRGLEAILAHPWSPSNVVLRDAMVTVSMGMAGLESLAQSQTSRKRAYESYSRTISGLRTTLTAPSSAEASLAAAILLLAMYEFAVECSQHKTAWRQHVCGLRGVVYQPGGAPSKCNIGRMSSLSHTMWNLRTLAPTLDAIFWGDLQPRELDVRTLRVHVRKLHKDLLVFKSVQEREAQLTLGEDVHGSTKWLGVHACLLLTARFLDASGNYLHRRDCAAWCSSSEYRKLEALRHDLVRYIVAETTTQLVDRAETPLDCQSSPPCLSDEIRVRPLKTVETLLMLFPLTVALSEAGSSSPEYKKLCALLDMIGNACLLPKASSMAWIEEKEQLEYTEVLDGLVLLSAAVDMDFEP